MGIYAYACILRFMSHVLQTSRDVRDELVLSKHRGFMVIYAYACILRFMSHVLETRRDVRDGCDEKVLSKNERDFMIIYACILWRR